MTKKQVIGGPLVINGRTLSLSRAIRAGDFIFVTGQVPLKVVSDSWRALSGFFTALQMTVN